MFQSRTQLNSPIANTKLTISKIIGPQQYQQQTQVRIKKTKVTRNFGVNTSRIMATENSFDLLRPITHSVFPNIGRQNHIQITIEDGLDQQYCVPVRRAKATHFYSSQPKQIKIQQQHRYNNNCKINLPKKEQKNEINPQVQKVEQGTNKIRKIVNLNLKNIQASLNQVRKSRTIYYKKQFQKQRRFDQDVPVVKKNYKVSNVSTKISKVSEPIRYHEEKKQIQKNNQKKSTHSMNSQVDLNKQVRKTIIEQKNMTNQKPKLIDIDYPDEAIHPDQKIEQKIKVNQQSNIQQEIEQNILTINLKTSISTLKRALIEGDQQLKIEFNMPQVLFNPPPSSASNQQLKQRMWQIFKHAGQQPLIITIKRYQDRVQLRCKHLCAIWFYNGQSYIGGWMGEKTLVQLNKHGIGVQFYGKSQLTSSIYYGQFKDNKKQGYGVLQKQNNQIYVGCWKNNKKQGWGRVYDADGKLKINGQFIQNQLICSQTKI